ncbi:MAG TPA: MoxR family ATPase [Candidatus Binatia bacterium]|nr:MoxR family ATPase [Candidatus Binatia bacterium]
MEATEIQLHEIAEIEEFAGKRDAMLGEIAKVIVGQDRVIEEVLIALFARGHCLLVGVPGLAKTLLISTLAEILDLDFNRIQFTPDLMPSDITGTDILQEDGATGRRQFQFLQGPIFTNILLADEINRTPPKTQAALLQSMQEYKITASGRTYPLDLPFFVLATQNPIEQEGTYPLPEAQLDRFMMNIEIRYPDFDDEVQIVMQTTSNAKPAPKKIMDGPAILRYQELVRKVPVSPFVVSYAVALAQHSRPQNADTPQFVKDYIEWGAGPRASQFLILGAKARTILQGRYAVSIEDIQAIAPSVLRHRIVPNFKAQGEGISSLDIINRLLAEVKASTDGKAAR